MSQKRYVVVAKTLRREPDGDSQQDGRPLWRSFIEERSYTFTADQPISAIFERLDRLDDVVEIRLLDDGSNRIGPAHEPDREEGFQRQAKY
ncbi:hypothetical protein [Mesorhizobium loti]|uniref:hypothetical protein n=1 Tax=Rhizobium loti TaxID=381 RepID=UPI00041CC488|nr:hypothetical protein [Mesorhizobium loti]